MRPLIDRPGLAVRAGGAVAFALLALLTAGSQAGMGATAMSDTYVFYSRSVGSAGTLGGSFTADAALVRTDASLPRIPRIGVFRRAMEPGAWGGLAAAIRSLGAPRSSGVQKPGTPRLA